MIWTDGVHLATGFGPESDPVALETMARALGLPARALQRPLDRPHYDLTRPEVLLQALHLGARLITPRDLVRLFRPMPPGWRPRVLDADPVARQRALLAWFG